MVGVAFWTRSPHPPISALIFPIEEVVEDLIVAAVKDAQEKASNREREEMQKLTESLGLPPGMNLPF